MKINRKELVDKEKAKLTELFKEVDPAKLETVEGLIENACFMYATLQEYSNDIIKNGSIEMFRQSENQQAYERVRPVVKEYNTMIRNYREIIRQLLRLLPNEVEEDDGFLELVRR